VRWHSERAWSDPEATTPVVEPHTTPCLWLRPRPTRRRLPWVVGRRCLGHRRFQLAWLLAWSGSGGGVVRRCKSGES
jgi:hypothetical protein